MLLMSALCLSVVELNADQHLIVHILMSIACVHYKVKPLKTSLIHSNGWSENVYGEHTLARFKNNNTVL